MPKIVEGQIGLPTMDQWNINYTFALTFSLSRVACHFHRPLTYIRPTWACNHSVPFESTQEERNILSMVPIIRLGVS
jgi:hypothetical protein